MGWKCAPSVTRAPANRSDLPKGCQKATVLNEYEPQHEQRILDE